MESISETVQDKLDAGQLDSSSNTRRESELTIVKPSLWPKSRQPKGIVEIS